MWNAAPTLAEAAAALGTTPKAAKSLASKLRAKGFALQDFRLGGNAMVARLQKLRTARDQLLTANEMKGEATRLMDEIALLRTRRGT